jgi:hypothetical protein
MLAEAMAPVRRELEAAQNTIIESNSVMRFLRPDIYLTVLDPATADFKDSAREYLDLATAIIMHEGDGHSVAWKSVSLKPAAGKPVFYVHPPQYCTAEIVNFVRQKLAAPVAI